MKLRDKTIVITGGAGGLGRAMVHLLVEKGAKLAIIDLDQEAVNNTLQQLPNAFGYAIDICDENQVTNVFKDIRNDLGPIHGLINSAGILRDGLLVKHKDNAISRMSLNNFTSVMNVNLTGTFLCGREAAAAMIEDQSKGVIINISSISRAGNYGQSNYSASKSAVVALTTTWCKELAVFGIRSAAIAPGFIATDMTASMPPAVLEKISGNIPVGRMGTPKEIATGAIFILENDYFNGRVLEIDGGMRI